MDKNEQKNPSRNVPEESYGLKIREIRIKNHLTQKDVADSLGVTPGYISNVENNRTAMSLRMLIYYAKLTGMTLDALVGKLEPEYEASSLDNKLIEKASQLTDIEKEKILDVIDIIYFK